LDKKDVGDCPFTFLNALLKEERSAKPQSKATSVTGILLLLNKRAAFFTFCCNWY
jgi:hypothetical protein